MFDVTELEPIMVLAIFVPLVLLYIAALVDVFRRHDLSVVRKTMWVVVILLTAYIGVALYFLTRPPRVPEGKQSGDTNPHSQSVVDQLDELRGAHDRGELDDEAFLDAKRRTFGLTPERQATNGP